MAGSIQNLAQAPPQMVGQGAGLTGMYGLGELAELGNLVPMAAQKAPQIAGGVMTQWPTVQKMATSGSTPSSAGGGQILQQATGANFGNVADTQEALRNAFYGTNPDQGWDYLSNTYGWNQNQPNALMASRPPTEIPTTSLDPGTGMTMYNRTNNMPAVNDWIFQTGTNLAADPTYGQNLTLQDLILMGKMLNG